MLDPPLPVNVLEGEIKGEQKKPVAGYIPTPWGKYPPGLPVPRRARFAPRRRPAGAAPRGRWRYGARATGRGGGRGLLAMARSRVLPWPTTLSRPGGSAGDRAAGGAPRRQSPNVRIVFTVLPSTKKATVFWGKKKLGVIEPHAPLIVQRPRDSGPLDVVVRAEGCVPVQTRAYTFADSKVAVKVTPNDQKNTLLGYREEIPAGGGGIALVGSGRRRSVA